METYLVGTPAMDKDSHFAGAQNPDGLRQLNPKTCDFAAPYMVDNGVLDIYRCKRFSGNCYFEPNGGKPFKKICESRK